MHQVPRSLRKEVGGGPSKTTAAGPARRRSSGLAAASSKTDAEEPLPLQVPPSLRKEVGGRPSKPAAAGPARRRSSGLAAASSNTATPLPLQVPPSLRKEVGPALRAADAVEHLRPRVAYLCRLYAFERVDRKDGSQFRTALSKRLEKDNVPSLAQRLKKSDALEVESFSKEYYQDSIRALDKAGRAECDKAYQTSRVLFEVLNFLNKDDDPPKITRAHKDVQENVDTYRQQLNSLPLDAAFTIRKPEEEEGREGFKKATDAAAVRENGPVAPTVINDIPADLLLEIFLLLPSLPSLVRAALACRTFLHAVRSCPTFLHRFQGLHLPQIIGFISLGSIAFPTFTPLRSCSDPDLAAAVRGSDFFFTRLPQDSGDSDLGWEILNCHGGYLVVVNQTTSQIAAYNPLTQALEIFPMPPQEMLLPHSVFEVHFVISEEDQRVVLVQHLEQLKSLAVFSSATWEWQVLPTPPDPDVQVPTFHRGSQLNGLIYWKHATEAYLLVLNTTTLEFHRMDLVGSMDFIDEEVYGLGQTKDGNLCVVGGESSDPSHGILDAWVWRAGDDGVEEWVSDWYLFLDSFFDPIEVWGDGTDGFEEPEPRNAKVRVEAVVDGFVYLCVESEDKPESLLSLCLKTKEVKRLVDGTYKSPALLYIMTWPPSLRCSQLLQATKDQNGSPI